MAWVCYLIWLGWLTMSHRELLPCFVLYSYNYSFPPRFSPNTFLKTSKRASIFMIENCRFQLPRFLKRASIERFEKCRFQFRSCFHNLLIALVLEYLYSVYSNKRCFQKSKTCFYWHASNFGVVFITCKSRLFWNMYKVSIPITASKTFLYLNV